MKTRTIFDISLIVIFLGAGSYLAYKYLGEPTKPIRPTLRLEEAHVAIGDKKVETLIRETGASDSEDSWYPEVMSNRWKFIKIYHSGLLSGNNSTLSDRSTNNKTSNDSGFHFVITNGYGGEDGKVTVTSRWKRQEDSSPFIKEHSSQDIDYRKTISICLIGDFDAQAPTASQISSLKGLLNYLFEATSVKSFNTSFNPLINSKKSTSPKLLPLDLILKTRTSR